MSKHFTVPQCVQWVPYMYNEDITSFLIPLEHAVGSLLVPATGTWQSQMAHHTASKKNVKVTCTSAWFVTSFSSFATSLTLCLDILITTAGFFL